MKEKTEKPTENLRASTMPMPCVDCKTMTYLHSQKAVYTCAWCMTAGVREKEANKPKIGVRGRFYG